LYEDNFNYLTKMCLGRMREAACRMIAQAHARGARVIVAGSDASDQPDPFLDAGADAVLMGEGIAALLELTGRLARDPAIDDRPWLDGVAGIATRVDGATHGRDAAGSPADRPPRLGPGGRRTLPEPVARAARLLQPQHGRVARLPVPLQLVRQADLGQTLQ